MPEQEHYQLDGSAPELYERYLVPAVTSLWARDLIARAAPASGERVLDVACGTGAVTRLAAEWVGQGRIVGLDLNAGMLAVARTASPGSAIEWIEGSALDLPFDDGSFDLVLCQLGLQFFPDRPLALREMKRVLAPSGRMALSVYSAIEHTPAAHAFVRVLDRQLGPDASRTKRAEHIFADADELAGLVRAAGFHQVQLETVTQRITFPSVLDYVRFQLVATPMASLLSDRDSAARETAIGDITSETKALLDPALLANGQLSFPQQAYVVMARAVA